jgi:hypothetical protein
MLLYYIYQHFLRLNTLLSKLTESQRTQLRFFGKESLGWDLTTKGRLLVLKEQIIYNDICLQFYSLFILKDQQFLR